MKFEDRYSCIVNDPQPMEIVLLQGRGCFWKKCRFCDYYDDAGIDANSIPLNARVLAQVTGEHGRLVALNSGSFFELPQATQIAITQCCLDCGITHLHIESHWRMADKVRQLRHELAEKGIQLHGRIGIETFDEHFREDVMVKGMGLGITPKEIAETFDECCLLFGMVGQSRDQYYKDIEIAGQWFSRVYVNIFNSNTTEIKADNDLIDWFIKEQYATIKKDPRYCVLIENTALGVGD